MKKIALTIAAFVGIFAFAACSEDFDTKIMKEADNMFAQAETDIQAVEDLDAFFACIEDLQAKKQEMTQKMMDHYSTDGENAVVPDEVSSHIYDRATAYNKIEAAKYAEFYTPLVDRMDKALIAIAESGNSEANMNEYQEALGALMQYSNYDNVLPELQDRCEEVINKMGALDLLPDIPTE